MTDMAVRIDLLYHVRQGAVVSDILEFLRAPKWVRSVIRLTAPRLNDASPAASSVLAMLENEWRILPSSDAETTSCVICMDDCERTDNKEACAVRLLCGHEYHFQCVRSWLQKRSSCPVCRHQFPRAINGKFALQRVESMLVLEDTHLLQLPRDEITSAIIVSERVRVIVNVRLQQANVEQDESAVPCELSACVVGPNGELLFQAERPPSPAAFSGYEQELMGEELAQACDNEGDEIRTCR